MPSLRRAAIHAKSGETGRIPVLPAFITSFPPDRHASTITDTPSGIAVTVARVPKPRLGQPQRLLGTVRGRHMQRADHPSGASDT